MLYLIALLCPPLACLMAGRFCSFMVNAFLCGTIIGIPIALIHAWLVVQSSYQADNITVYQSVVIGRRGS